MTNQEYTQLLEEMIVSLTGIELPQLHEAVRGRLSEMAQTDARMRQLDKRAETSDDLRAHFLGKKERASKAVFGMHGKKLARSLDAYRKRRPYADATNDTTSAGDNRY